MAICEHGEVCREYMKRGTRILSTRCPNGCPFFKQKSLQDNVKQINDSMENIARALDKIGRRIK